jgi:serine protease Do
MGATALVAGALLLVPPLAQGDPPGPSLPPDYNPAQSFAPLVQAVSGAVVSIEVEEEVPEFGGGELPPFFQEFFGVDPEDFGPRLREGQGSGFIISSDGLLLTNHHVVAHSRKLKVNFSDGSYANAVLLGSDPDLDVALLQLPQDREWPWVELGSSGHVEVGDWVVAAGNPLGLGLSVTAGIISGKGRPSGFSGLQEFLQTDAAINLGNSGGPLFGLDGRVIGINTMIIAGANTVGFSVPIDLVKDVLEDLRTSGRVVRGFIGVTTEPLSLAEAHDLGVSHGAVVRNVHPETPAAEAGLRTGDVIVAVDDRSVEDAVALTRAISRHRPGDTIGIKVVRDGEFVVVKATLVDRQRWLEDRE